MGFSDSRWLSIYTFIELDFRKSYFDQTLSPFFSLAKKSFKQLVNRPTHVEGGKLDQLYVRKLDVVDVSLHHPYYSDHDAIIAMFET